MIGTLLHHYEITGKLGAGGMGEVYRARDSRLGRDVAIKVLPRTFAADADRLRRFEDEAKTLAALNHPNILTIHDTGIEDGAPYLVSELLEGQTLREMLGGETPAPLPLRKVMDYALQIAQGLAAAHAKGIIHRDLKPENIFITRDGRLKILDFGLAKLVGPLTFGNNGPAEKSDGYAATIGQSTEPGTVLGTIGYMSPEQVRGEAADHRSDIFSFGCILYEMLAGRRAFQRATGIQTLNAILTEEPAELTASNPNFSPALDRLIQRCLEKEPERRFQSASDLAFALESLSGSAPVKMLAEAAGPRPVSLAFGGRNVAWAAAGAAVALVAFLLLRQPGLLSARSTPRVSVLTAPLPESVNFPLDSAPTLVAVSPDGSQIAFVGESAGMSRLYVRGLGDRDARAIEGSNLAHLPFFSDDSAYAALIAIDGGIKTVPLAGGAGAASAVSRAAWSQGASWRGSQIVFNLAPAKGEGLRHINVANGQVELLLAPDSSKGELNYFWPQLLPGNEAVLYTAKVSGDVQGSRLIVESLQEKGRRTEIGQGSMGRYVSTGHIIYGRGGSLWAVAFDRHRLTVSGVPKKVLDGILINPYFRNEAFDVSEHGNGTLIYVTSTKSPVGRRIVRIDHTGKTEDLDLPTDAYTELAVDPTGKRLAVAIGSVSADIAIFDLTKRTWFKNATDPRHEADPAWSLDGKWMYFMSDREGLPDIYRIASDGSGEAEKIVSSEFVSRFPAPDPSGKLLAYTEYAATTKSSDIYLTEVDGAHSPRPFLNSPANESLPAISPDGKWLAYISDRNRDQQYDVFVTSFPERGAEIPLSKNGGDQPQWSRDGKELFFRAEDNLVAVTRNSDGSFSEPRPIARLKQIRHNAAFSTGSYALAPEGEGIFAIEDAEPEPALRQIMVVQNWFDELKRQLSSPDKP